MTTTSTPAWAEAIQLIPILTLAFPFIVTGEVDLSAATSGFVVASALAVLCSIKVRLHRHPLNPILLGTNLWLALGALAFGLDVDSLRAWFGETQAFGLFAAVLGVGIVTLRTPTGFVGGRSPDRPAVQRASVILLGLAVLAVLWAWIFRDDIRVGGGLPFIALNVARRVLLRRMVG